MITKKLFTPKCQHIDRDIVFQSDIDNFFVNFISQIYTNKIVENNNLENYEKDLFNLDEEENSFENFNEKITEDDLLKDLSYKKFKKFWAEKKMSMLHFSKSKEENSKEYYEVLFGEIQNFLIENNLQRKKEFNSLHLFVQIISIYSIYSLYFTQTTDFFYQINTIPEYLLKINYVIHALIKKGNMQISKELLLMVNRLHKNSAFSIGVIPGLKTIILNKYGLPTEKKANTYKDLLDINNSQRNLKNFEQDKKLNELIDTYQNNKFNSLKSIKKEINEESFKENKDIYCDFINNKNQGENSFKSDLGFLSLDKVELNKNINNLDLQLNFFD